MPKLTYQADLPEDYDPDLYARSRVDEGLLLSETDDATFVERFARDGYVAIRDFFSPQRAADGRQALIELVKGSNPNYDLTQHVMLEAKGRDLVWEELSLEQREDVVRVLCDFAEFDPRLGGLMSDVELLRHVSLLMDAATPKIFQQMALIKPPRIGREKPWHQDHAYFRVPLDVPLVGCWIALDPATIENGCMHVLPGAHREGPVVHHLVRDWQICDNNIIGRGSTAVPLPPGGVLFFSSMLPHGTPVNRSDQRRRAVQYHYAPADHPSMDEAAHKALFGDKAGDVPC